jgi:hypothetical protein
MQETMSSSKCWDGVCFSWEFLRNFKRVKKRQLCMSARNR